MLERRCTLNARWWPKVPTGSGWRGPFSSGVTIIRLGGMVLERGDKCYDVGPVIEDGIWERVTVLDKRGMSE